MIGEKTAENIKMAIGSVIACNPPLEASIRGRDLVTGLPREVIITDGDVREAIASSIDNLIESVKEVLETTPPEILSDVMNRGVYLTGGGALIKGLRELLHEFLKIPVHVAEEPLTSVARGSGIILENLEEFRDILIANEDELPFQK